MAKVSVDGAKLNQAIQEFGSLEKAVQSLRSEKQDLERQNGQIKQENAGLKQGNGQLSVERTVLKKEIAELMDERTRSPRSIHLCFSVASLIQDIKRSAASQSAWISMGKPCLGVPAGWLVSIQVK